MSPTLYCTFTGTTVKVYNGFPTQSNIKRFTLQVNNVLNPFPAK